MGEVTTEVDGAVGTLVISNPGKHNAMSKAMWIAFAAAIESLDADSQVRVIVIRGAGEAFVSGADISQFGEQRTSPQDQREYDAIAERAYQAPQRASKPVIAAIRGYCIGGGLGLAAACDLRICASDSRFRMPAARLGLGYSVAGVRRFVALVGYQNVLDLFVTARPFDASDALRAGFVTQVVPPAELEETVLAVARSIAQNAPLTIRAVKLAARAALQDDVQLEQAAERAILACAESADYREGALAFVEKRRPAFTGT